MTQEKRFSGVEGSDYDLVERVAFGPARMANKKVGKVIRDYFDKSDNRVINVLDLGCGTGITSEIVLNADPRIRVFAVDEELVTLNQATEKLRKYELASRFMPTKSDALEYITGAKIIFSGYKNFGFDAVTSGFMIHNMGKEKRAKLIKEIYLALSPKGIFVNADKIAQDNEREHEKSLDWQMNQFAKLGAMGKQLLKERWVKHYLIDDQPDLKMAESEYIGYLQNAGFSNVKKVFRRHMDTTYVARKG